MLAIVAFTLAATAAPINSVLPCGKVGTVGGLGAGLDLTRYTVDVAKFPNAICNDGTPGVFYYAPATKDEDRNKWFIFLQGGGACIDGQTCAERWCHVNTNYGMDKMTTSLTKPMIRADGFLDPRPDNRFGSWNRVLIFYCSSDAWSGTASTTFTATAGSATAEYQIHFRGAQIIDAVLDTLRNATPLPRRRAAKHSSDLPPGEIAAASAWPDLDNATHVLFAGSSAGGIGAKSNADHVGAKLRASNPGLVYRLLIDASTTPQSELRDFKTSTYCGNDPVRGCDYASFTAAQYAYFHSTFGSRRDESCLAIHTAEPWRCEDTMHANYFHITTPFFIHQDLQDPQIGGDFVDAGFGDMSDYARGLEADLRALPTPEEPRGTVGIFAPQCTDHESVTNDAATFDVKIDGLSYYDTVWNWWSGSGATQKIVHFTTPGKLPGCPQ